MLTTKKIQETLAAIQADTQALADSGAFGRFAEIEVNTNGAIDALARGNRHGAAGALALAARCLYGDSNPKAIEVCNTLAYRNCGFAKFPR